MSELNIFILKKIDGKQLAQNLAMTLGKPQVNAL